jgi:hypothetical protein
VTPTKPAGTYLTADSYRRFTVGVGRVRLRISILVYAIIVSLASLAVYDEPDGPLTLANAAVLLAIVVAPVAALAVAHTFVELTQEHLEVGETPSRAALGRIVGRNAQFLVVGVSALIWFVIAYALDMSANDALVALLLIRLVELYALGIVVALRSTVGCAWRIGLSVGYGTIGLVIVVVELALGH